MLRSSQGLQGPGCGCGCIMAPLCCTGWNTRPDRRHRGCRKDAARAHPLLRGHKQHTAPAPPGRTMGWGHPIPAGKALAKGVEGDGTHMENGNKVCGSGCDGAEGVSSPGMGAGCARVARNISSTASPSHPWAAVKPWVKEALQPQGKAQAWMGIEGFHPQLGLALLLQHFLCP